MKRKMNKRLVALLLSVGLLLAASVGFTVAYVLMQTGTITNIFAPSRVACDVVKTDSAVSVRNTGNIDAYIRVKIVVTWKNDAGEVYAQAPSEYDYTLKYGDKDNWILGSDGFWYYAKAVNPDETTDILIQSCVELIPSNAPEGYRLSVEILASAIQETSDAVSDWSQAVTAPSDGADLVKNS